MLYLAGAVLVVLAAAWAYFRDRRLRQLGLAQALAAEAKVNTEDAEASLEGWLEKTKELLLSGNRPYITIYIEENSIMDNIQEDFYLLPGSVIERLVRYRKLDRFVSIALRNIASDEFMALSEDRKLAHIANLEKIVENYVESGKDANEILGIYEKERRRVGGFRDIFVDRWSSWSPSRSATSTGTPPSRRR